MRIIFIATGNIAVPALRLLLHSKQHQLLALVTQPDRPSGRDQIVQHSQVKELAHEKNVPVLQPEKIRSPEAIAQLRALHPEIIVTMAYGQILPREVLETPSLACLNLHASLLPRHRGAAPVQAAIEAGDVESGITVMYMDEGVDSGDVLLWKKIPVLPSDTAASLEERLALLAPEALAEALDLLAKGEAPRIPQDETQATYARKLTRENGAIEWSLPCEIIDRKVRAMNPWPAAHTFLPAQKGVSLKLKIYSCEPLPHEAGTAGEVLRNEKSGILVAAGSGAVLLREVQLEGRKRMDAAEFLRGHQLPPGTRLG